MVVQVERCELALLIGYTAGTGESTERIIARAASQPKSHAVDALRDTLAAYAMAPLAVTADGKPLVPTSLRAKIGLDASGTRPIVVVLATFPLPAGATALALTSRDPRTTRISWRDQSSGRIITDRSPAQDHWFTGVASFLLTVAAAAAAAAASGGPSCTSSGSAVSTAGSSSSSPSSPGPAR
jgi:hypothetical protein